MFVKLDVFKKGKNHLNKLRNIHETAAVFVNFAFFNETFLKPLKILQSIHKRAKRNPTKVLLLQEKGSF